jgi:HPt (histidine-containing phosphotransfer) domain-containing protein
MSRPYDRERLVELFGDDRHTLAEVERDFLETVRSAEREIAGTDDLAVVARVAHRLKGASGMIGAMALCHLASGIEQAAKAADRPGLKRLHGALGEEARRVAEQADVGRV